MGSPIMMWQPFLPMLYSLLLSPDVAKHTACRVTLHKAKHVRLQGPVHRAAAHTECLPT